MTYCQFSECFVIRKLTLTKNSSSSNHHLRRNSSYFQKNFPQHFFGLLLSRMTILFSFREKFSPSSLFFNYSVLYSIFNEASLNICVDTFWASSFAQSLGDFQLQIFFIKLQCNEGYSQAALRFLQTSFSYFNGNFLLNKRNHTLVLRRQ